MGKLIVTCGLDSIGDSKNDMWQYDTLTGIWHQLSSIPAIERRGGIAFTTATSLYYTIAIDSNDQRLIETWKCESPAMLVEESDFSTSIHPNPIQDQLTISSYRLQLNSNCRIYDMNGIEIVNETIEGSKTIDFSDYSSVVCVLIISSSRRVFRKKLMKI